MHFNTLNSDIKKERLARNRGEFDFSFPCSSFNEAEISYGWQAFGCQEV
jgi:hypothetical protein